jgi:hypothetical protein
MTLSIAVCGDVVVVVVVADREISAFRAIRAFQIIIGSLAWTTFMVSLIKPEMPLCLALLQREGSQATPRGGAEQGLSPHSSNTVLSVV